MGDWAGSLGAPCGHPKGLLGTQSRTALTCHQLCRHPPPHQLGSPPWAWPGAHLWSAGASTQGPFGRPHVAPRRQGLWGSPALRTCPWLPAGGALLAWDPSPPEEPSEVGAGVRQNPAPSFQGEADFEEDPRVPEGGCPVRGGAPGPRGPQGLRTGQDGTGRSSVSRCRAAAPGPRRPPVREAGVWVKRGV